MTDTKEHTNIYAALCAAQTEFGAVKKGAVNPAFKSRYADLADVATVAIPVLARHGVCVLHYFTADHESLRTEFVHAPSGSKVHCDVPLKVDKQNMQGLKSATTYARRMGIEHLSGLAPEDDDGNAAAEAPKPSITAQDITDAKAALAGAETLDELRDVWSNLSKPVQSSGPVIAAKDERKAALQAPASDQVADDEIPY